MSSVFSWLNHIGSEVIRRTLKPALRNGVMAADDDPASWGDDMRTMLSSELGHNIARRDFCSTIVPCGGRFQLSELAGLGYG